MINFVDYNGGNPIFYQIFSTKRLFVAIVFQNNWSYNTLKGTF